MVVTDGGFYERDPRDEESGQVDLVNWLHRAHPKAWDATFHVPNGGYRARKTAARMKLLGVKRGVPDLIMLLPRGDYCGLAIELKRSEGRYKASDDQWLWLDRFTASGFMAVCCRVSEAPDVICSYLSLD